MADPMASPAVSVVWARRSLTRKALPRSMLTPTAIINGMNETAMATATVPSLAAASREQNFKNDCQGFFRFIFNALLNSRAPWLFK